MWFIYLIVPFISFFNLTLSKISLLLQVSLCLKILSRHLVPVICRVHNYSTALSSWDSALPLRSS